MRIVPVPLVLALLLATKVAAAQDAGDAGIPLAPDGGFALPPNTPPPPPPPSYADGPSVGFQEYLARVGRRNLSAAAARLEVPIARAQIDIARIFPNPILTGGVGSVDISGTGSPTSTTVQLFWPLELFGKRDARVALALEGNRLAQSDLEVFLRALRADATDAYIDALHARLVLARKQATLASLERLVAMNEYSHGAGASGEILTIQSRVEAARYRSDVLAAIGEVRAADEALAVYLGQTAGARAFAPRGDLTIAPRDFDMTALIASAHHMRADLRSRRLAVVQSQRAYDLVGANRVPDVGIGIGWNHTFSTNSGVAFQNPDYDTLGAAVSIALPLSNIYRGDLEAAERARDQRERMLEAAELTAEVQVRQALARYESTAERLALYRGPLLSDAERVFESVLYTYLRAGSGTQLEVLTAQRTVDALYIDYYDALADHAHALVALEQAAGIWDVDF